MGETELSLHRVSEMKALIFGFLFPSLVFFLPSYFGLFPLCSPLPGSLATHALRGEMRHTGNLQADNGRQLLLLHKSFMSWISCTSLCSLPPTHASLIANWSRHSNTPCGKLGREKTGQERQSMTGALSDRHVIALCKNRPTCFVSLKKTNTSVVLYSCVSMCY